ncbi:MAG: 4a-hydroxytetrahydrobiopterin dehydratase [Fimbriimonadaceae bacterium]|jgi:4a-hydroxytetrahydrobiopterin dehydratase|nr:4a-hydroxytetrahydrobiopterin dehydratase [Fimbriimonadaceae bacterium]
MTDLSYDKLSPELIDSAIKDLEGWQVVEGALTKTFAFETYASGLAFAAAVGHLADRLDHHPDILIGYKKVTVSMITHDAGGGLTSYDFELARRISERL